MPDARFVERDDLFAIHYFFAGAALPAADAAGIASGCAS
jgi:hypothetical protein